MFFSFYAILLGFVVLYSIVLKKKLHYISLRNLDVNVSCSLYTDDDDDDDDDEEVVVTCILEFEFFFRRLDVVEMTELFRGVVAFGLL